MLRFFNWLQSHRVGRAIIRQIDRLPEPRLSPYEELIRLEDMFNPIYVVFLPLIMWLDYRANHGFGWSFGLLAIYLAFVIWMLCNSTRWRNHWKPKLRGSISTEQGSSEFLSLISDAIHRAKDGKPDDVKIDFSRLINRCWRKYADGLAYSNTVVDVVPYLDHNGLQQHEVTIRFTLWFRTTAEAVEFKLLHSDDFDYATK